MSQLGVGLIGEQSNRIGSRGQFEATLALCRRAHPEVEIVVFEPSRSDTVLFLQSPMSFQRRRRVMEYASQLTLQTFDARAEWYHHLFDGYGSARALAS